MNPRQLIALTFSLCCSFKADAQRAERNHLHFSNRIFVKAAPLSLLDRRGSLFPVAIEYAFGETWGIQLEAGIPLYFNIQTVADMRYGLEKKITYDWKLAAELRHYFSVNKNNRWYFGVEGFYRPQNFSIKNNFYISRTRGWGQWSFSSADVRKVSSGVAGVIGISKSLGPNIFLDIQTGLGIHFLDVKYLNVVDLNRRGDLNYFVFVEEEKINMYAIRPYIPSRLRISFLLGR